MTPTLLSLSAVSLCAALSSHAAVTLISDDFTSGSVSSGGTVFSEVDTGWVQSTGTWAISGGSLTNTSTDTTAGDRAVAYMIDLSGLGLTASDTKLDISFDFTAQDSDALYFNLFGYNTTAIAASAGSSLINSGATNGNAWTSGAGVDMNNPASDRWAITNLVTGAAQGPDAPNVGEAAQAFSFGGTTGGSVSESFDLSTIVSGGATNLAGYDYLVLTITRTVPTGLTSASVTIDNFNMTAIPEPGTYALLAGLAGLSAVMVRRRR
ncbi:PEP-CTERM sorting domain-containing protein [Lentimonas sp. CC19]|nr:PEP-CTERM sorting domain-containing protein [Lentimonas sp. CC19]